MLVCEGPPQWISQLCEGTAAGEPHRLMNTCSQVSNYLMFPDLYLLFFCFFKCTFLLVSFCD